MPMLSRRAFLRLAAGAVLGVLAGGCRLRPGPAPAPGPAVPAPLQRSFVGVITVFAGTYTPNSARVWGRTPVDNHDALNGLKYDWLDTHPLLLLTFVESPPLLPLDTWITSQVLLNTGPDIITAPLSFMHNLAAMNGAIPLNDYLAQPNPYRAGPARLWGSDFGTVYPSTAGAKGILGGVPLDKTATGVYINRSLAEKAGIDLDAALASPSGAPPDWAALLDWCARFKAAGALPFGMASSVLEGWLQGVLVDQLLWPLTARFDTLNYNSKEAASVQAGRVSLEEIFSQLYCGGWQPFEEPAVRGLLELIKNLVPFMPVGYDTSNILTYSEELFQNGELAMLWDGCWLVHSLVTDAHLGFDYASFWLPPVTEASSAFARQPPVAPHDIGAYDSAMGINIAALQRGNLDDCLDWLMFVSAPQNLARVINEVPLLVPAAPEADVQPDIVRLLGQRLGDPQIDSHTWPAPLYWMGPDYSEYTDAFQRQMALYLRGEASLDELAGAVSEAMRSVQDQVLTQNAVQYTSSGTWDLTQWPCTPAVQGG
ncbi:MAG: extracellular solute-binding protein [Anaerolineae bacterium]